MAVELYPHQRKAVDSLDNGKILWGGVGTGKSLTAAVYYMERERPRDVFVITTAKKRDSLDWEKEFAQFGVGKSQYATVAGVLTVDSWNNIGNYADVHGAFFIFDEQRLVGSGAWTKAFIRIAKSNRWILLSATPGDTWLDYIPVFVANGFYKNRTEFKREHVVYSRYSKFPKVERYLGVGTLVRHRNALLVEMPYLRHTRRITEDILVEHDSEALKTVMEKRWNIFEERPLRDIAEMFSVARRVVNTDPTRLSSVRRLMEKHPRLIVFYNFNYELEMLRMLVGTSESITYSTKHKAFPDDETSRRNDQIIRSLTGTDSSGSGRMTDDITSLTRSSSSTKKTSTRPGDKLQTPDSTTAERTTESSSDSDATCGSSVLTVAEWNGHKHQEIPQTERWLYLVQYAAGAEGWNCIETDAMVFFSLTYSYKNWHQAFGRIDRLNTPYKDLHYYILQSNSWIDKAVRKSLRNKQNFNESDYMRQKERRS